MARIASSAASSDRPPSVSGRGRANWTPDLRRSADSVPDTRGWKRAAIFTFGAALTVAGCSSTTTASDAAPQDTAADTVPADNAPVDAARDVPDDDNGGVAPPYGIAPEDAGPADNGSMKADYGAPPPRDAGLD